MGRLRSAGIGHHGGEFCFDNEMPLHPVFLQPYRLASRLVTAPRYRLSFGALLIGVASALLFLLEGTWTYTNYLREQTRSCFFGGSAVSWLRSAMVLTLFAGMLTSSLHRGSFRWRWPDRHNWRRRVLGGFLMGAGGALVPGGNDTLILVQIPTLSLQAMASYVALLAGIGTVLLFMRSSPEGHPAN